MIFVPIIWVIIFAIAFAPTGGRRSYRGRKSKGFIGSLMKKQTPRVFCGPGGVGHRGGRRR